MDLLGKALLRTYTHAYTVPKPETLQRNVAELERSNRPYPLDQ